VNNASPTQNNGNVIENVNMSHSFGETGCAIAIANAVAEVRRSTVTGYPIGFGGWKMEQAYFHHNTATDTQYGFNIDSLNNNAVRIEQNSIFHPRKYGIVIGGDATFSAFSISENTIAIDQSGVIGLVLRGNVTGALVRSNKFVAENASGAKATAVQSMALKSGAPNRNSFQSNQIAAKMKTVFSPGSDRQKNCFSHNVDEHGSPRHDLPDNDAGCAASGNLQR
jgi:hypothetical protein